MIRPDWISRQIIPQSPRSRSEQTHTRKCLMLCHTLVAQAPSTRLFQIPLLRGDSRRSAPQLLSGAQNRVSLIPARRDRLITHCSLKRSANSPGLARWNPAQTSPKMYRGREVRFLLRTPLPPNRTCGFIPMRRYSPVNRPSSGTDRRVDGPWLVNTGPVR